MVIYTFFRLIFSFFISWIFIVFCFIVLLFFFDFIDIYDFSLFTFLHFIFYYIPHSAIVSVLVFFSFFMFKFRDRFFNRFLFDNFRLYPGSFFVGVNLFFYFIFFLLIFFYEFWFPRNYDIFHYQDNSFSVPEDYDSSFYADSIFKVLDKVSAGKYYEAVKLVNYLLDTYPDSFIFNYLLDIIKFVYNEDIDMQNKALEQFSDFTKFVKLFNNGEYIKLNNIFKSDNSAVSVYFIAKINLIMDYMQIDSDKEKKLFQLNILLDLANKMFLANKDDISDYVFFLMYLNALFPENDKIIDILYDNDFYNVYNKDRDSLDTLFSSLYSRNMYFYDKDVTFFSKQNFNYSMGKTFFVFSNISFFHYSIVLKNVVMIPVDFVESKKFYFFDYVKILFDKMYFYNANVLFSNSGKKAPFNNSLYGFFKLSDNFDVNNLLYINNKVKFVSFLSLKQLNYISAMQDFIYPVEEIFLDRLAYYFTSILLFIIFLFFSYSFKGKLFNLNNFFYNALIWCFYIFFIFFAFDFIKRFVLIIISKIY